MASIEEIEALLDKKLAPLQGTLGSLVEANMRKEAEKMFGVSFAKRFLIRSLHDAVHLVTKSKFDGLTPGAVDKRSEAAASLAAEAKKFAIPLAKAFLLSFDSQYGATNEAKKAFNEDEDYDMGLWLLVEEGKKNDKVPGNVEFFLERLKKAFPKTNSGQNQHAVLEAELLKCDGPGVMLLELASKYTAEELEKESDIFEKGKLHDQIENDLRGTIALVEHHATITCGEVKSSFSGLGKGKDQLLVRTRFLKTAVDTIFPGKFREFVLIGHLFVPVQTTEGTSQHPSNELIGEKVKVSIYIHAV